MRLMFREIKPHLETTVRNPTASLNLVQTMQILWFFRKVKKNTYESRTASAHLKQVRSLAISGSVITGRSTHGYCTTRLSQTYYTSTLHNLEVSQTFCPISGQCPFWDCWCCHHHHHHPPSQLLQVVSSQKVK